MFKNIRHIMIAVSLLATGCGYNRFDALTPSENTTIPNIEIRTIIKMYHDKPVTAYEDYIVGGYVTSSDKERNFYRTFVIEDHSGALEIAVGLYSIYNIYPPGQYVTVRLQGLRFAKKSGVINVGLHPQAGDHYDVREFEHQAILNDYVNWKSETEIVQGKVVNINGLKEAMCGQLITVRWVSAVKPEDDTELTWSISKGWDGKPQTAFREFRDENNYGIFVESSGYASFADQPVPVNKQVSITGILKYGKVGAHNDQFILKIRDLDDVEIR